MESLLIGLLAGLAATPHCLGMCGGFALHLSRPTPRGRRWGRFAAFLGGKLAGYAFLGSLGGALGVWVLQGSGMAQGRSYLAWGAAVLTIVMGLALLDPLPQRWRWRWSWSAGGGRLGDWLAGWAPALDSPGAPLVLGLMAGFLPCPLTTSLLVVAAGGNSVSGGLLLLAGAGLGTAPGLLAVGLAGATVSTRWRRVGVRALGAVVLAVGILMLLRRWGLLPGAGPACCG
ncbi:MAG TPA: sulfite exporter TauE/SafE family protein [Armatimonadota bacterium]|jgi:hypothetical protein